MVRKSFGQIIQIGLRASRLLTYPLNQILTGKNGGNISIIDGANTYKRNERSKEIIKCFVGKLAWCFGDLLTRREYGRRADSNRVSVLTTRRHPCQNNEE